MVDIAKCDDATAREIQWQLIYYETWEELPNKRLQSALETLLKHPSLGNVHDLITDRTTYERLLKQAGIEGADRAMKHGVGRLVAEEVVAASFGRAKRAGGKTAGVAAKLIQETASRVAFKGGSMARKGVQVIGSLPVGIATSAGELVGERIAHLAGVKNPHGKNALCAAGSIAGGAIAGAVVGGPVGAATGAAVGAVSWGIGNGIKALAHAQADGNASTDNWCYIQVGNIADSKLCVGTYAGNGSMHWRSSWKEYAKSHRTWDMSAGQKPAAPFQLCIWEGRRVIQHFNVVHYRDMFGIIKRNGKFRVVHCKGSYHGRGAGKVDFFET